MATPNHLEPKKLDRLNRYFSDDFKRKKVDEIDKRITTIREICKTYEVSATAVYKWIYKFSIMKKKSVKMVVEAQSDTKKIEALKLHIAQLEQSLGQKQFEIDFLKKQMDIAGELYGVDIKKKPSGKPSPGSGNSESNIPTK